jgi:conjugal transfer pilus assembly protein TraV
LRWIKPAIIVICMTMTGCATSSVLNPFESGFKCNATSVGECIPLNEAYDVALEIESEKKGEESGTDENDNDSSKSLYTEALYKEVTSLLEKPKTPLVIPPKTVRVLILPYKDSNGTLYMQRYLYFFAGEPEWVLDVESMNDQ